MIKNSTFLLSIFLFLGCNHPESKTYERNQKSTYSSLATETESQPKSVYSYNEEIENTPIPPTYETNNRNVLQMEVQNGVRYVWIEINDIKLRFIFDTGASSICISSAEALVLYRQGLLQKEDFIGLEYFQDATGKISEGTKINLRKVKIGNIVLENVEATIIDNINAPLLLGQTAFERFGTIEIDNMNNKITFK